jgi:hypothetical protein
MIAPVLADVAVASARRLLERRYGFDSPFADGRSGHGATRSRSQAMIIVSNPGTQGRIEQFCKLLRG